MIEFKNILERRNRGILLDIVMFAVNAFLIMVLARRLADVVDEAHQGVIVSKMAMALYCGALVFLQPVGAILKSRRVSQRCAGEDHTRAKFVSDFAYFYLVSQVILMGAGISFLMGLFGQRHLLDSICLGQAALALLLGFVNLMIINLYRTPPNRKPLLKFFDSPQSEMLGDLCLLLNVILAQAFWGFLMLHVIRHELFAVTDGLFWLNLFIPAKDYTVVAKLGWLLIALLVFYLSPRFIFLIEDKHRKTAWLTMLLANSPVFYRMFFAST